MLLRDSVYQAIRRAILTCEYEPGQELREQALAERFQVSRSPVRDSLLRLEYENLVTVLPRQGYRVNAVTMSDVEEIVALRSLLEPACARAASQATDMALATLDQFRGFADSDYTESAFVEYNESFHRTVADLSGNRRLAAVSADVAGQFERLTRVGRRAFRHEQVRGLCAQHEAIIDALQAHDADRAERISHQHAEDARVRLGTAVRLAREQRQLPDEPAHLRDVSEA